MMLGRISLALLLSLCFAFPLLAAPQIDVEQPNHDFGEVVQGDKVEFVYRFRNVGDEILELGRVQTSCGCTAGLLSARRLAAGDTGELRASFDSSRFRGVVHKTISLETNDPQQQKVVFNLTGRVLVELLMAPERISWHPAQADQKTESQVVISNRGKTAVNLQPPQVTNKQLSAELSSQQLLPGGQVVLTVRGQFPPNVNRISGYVVVATDYKAIPQLRLPVNARRLN